MQRRMFLAIGCLCFGFCIVPFGKNTATPCAENTKSGEPEEWIPERHVSTSERCGYALF